MTTNNLLCNGLVSFSEKLNGFNMEVVLHAKILGIEKYKSGIPAGYKALIIFEVERYLKGENPTSSIVKIYTTDSAPDVFELAVQLIPEIETYIVS